MRAAWSNVCEEACGAEISKAAAIKKAEVDERLVKQELKNRGAFRMITYSYLLLHENVVLKLGTLFSWSVADVSTWSATKSAWIPNASKQ
jgi:hypothetical protein